MGCSHFPIILKSICLYMIPCIYMQEFFQDECFCTVFSYSLAIFSLWSFNFFFMICYNLYIL